ncbi:glycosyl transferase, partial [Rozella allomycis CSF55]
GFELSLNQKERLRDKLLEHDCVPVFLTENIGKGHYDGYGKGQLWPLFHYLLWENVEETMKNEKDSWDAYVLANELYVDAIMSVYEEGDTGNVLDVGWIVWIHDYHLLLVPQMLRKKIPEALIGFFLHSPFPTSEIFRCLPRRKEVLMGVLGSNLIGFQTYSYARHFISSCTRVLGLESTPKGVDYKGFLVMIGIFPIGVDVERIEKRRKSEKVKKKIEVIKEMFGNKKLIVGRDKLDEIKGVQHKLNSFEKFLSEYPEFRNQVVLVQVTTPGREVGHKNKKKIETRVSEIISRINGKYGSLEFVPVHHFHHQLERDE